MWLFATLARGWLTSRHDQLENRMEAGQGKFVLILFPIGQYLTEENQMLFKDHCGVGSARNESKQPDQFQTTLGRFQRTMSKRLHDLKLLCWCDLKVFK